MLLVDRLYEKWRTVRKGAAHTPEETESFTKWVHARPNSWYPVPRAAAQTMCKPAMSVSAVASDHQSTPSSTLPKTPHPSKRTRSASSTTSSSSTPILKKRKRRLKMQTPTTRTAVSDTNDWSSATSCSSSDDGNVEQEWVKLAETQWRRRPEPQRSEALRNLTHTIKVRDGETMEYATLFAWASYQRQSQYGDAIRKLVAMRCVQEKIGERQYKKDVVPHYEVVINHTRPITTLLLLLLRV